MAVQNLFEALFQDSQIQMAVETDCPISVICGCPRIELIEEPHPLLCEREWDDPFPGLWNQRRNAFG